MTIDTSSHTIHLTYCLNIHPGETYAENLAAIEEHACAVRDQFDLDGPFGVGLRLSAKAAAELAAPEILQPFVSLLQERGLYVFTINGFPYGTFHGVSVKENAYKPDWTDPRRIDYTRRLARILAALLPEGVDGSISTVPGTYRQWCTPVTEQAMIDNLLTVVADLALIEQRTGRRIGLALEPEPDCVWDQPAHLIELFNRRLGGADSRLLQEVSRDIGASPEATVRRHLGVCLDTCHQCVLFDDPLTVVEQFLEHDIPVHKLQVSAAPVFSCSETGLQEAATFIDPVYLHQTCIRTPDGQLQRYRDLPEALATANTMDPASELRTHFHIPLVLEPNEDFQSTRQDLTPAFWKRVATIPVKHVEVETYSFDVLPAHLRKDSVDENIAAELRWTRHAIEGALAS